MIVNITHDPISTPSLLGLNRTYKTKHARGTHNTGENMQVFENERPPGPM